jgi:hypothetical protein
LAYISPKFLRVAVFIQVQSIDDMLYFSFLGLFYNFLSIFCMIVIFLDDAIGDVIFFEVEDFGTD